VLVELIVTCRALGLMRLAHSQSISSACTHENNRTSFTYYATSIPRFDYVSCYASRVNRQFLLLELLFVQVDQSKNRNLSRLSNMNSTFTHRELSYFGNLQVNYPLRASYLFFQPGVSLTMYTCKAYLSRTDVRFRAELLESVLFAKASLRHCADISNLRCPCD